MFFTQFPQYPFMGGISICSPWIEGNGISCLQKIAEAPQPKNRANEKSTRIKRTENPARLLKN